MITKVQMQEFLDKLEGPEGCNFQQEVPGDANTITWQCAGGNNQDLSKKVLRSMGISENDIAIILSVAHNHGGHCDCEILFNATEALLSCAENN